MEVTIPSPPAPAAAAPRRALQPIPASAVRVALGEPVTVSLASPSERMWGFWQFPTLSRLPGGDILLTVNNVPDDDLCYGHAGPAWLSHDDGLTWHAADLDEKDLTISHSPIAEVFDGEFVCVPMPLGMRPGELPAGSLGEPVGKFFSYVWRLLYPLERFPAAIRDYMTNLRGLRWDPAARRWNAETFRWDTRGALLRVEDGGVVGKAMSCTSLEYCPLRFGDAPGAPGVLLDANYKVQYLHDDGSTPRGFEVVCMASYDNGRSWQRRGLIAHDPAGVVGPSEAAISATARGDLVCVARTTDHRQLPLWVTFSEDRGRTWSEPAELFDHGVLPQLELLGNGVLALSYGRPGVHLSFSPDGSGREWTEPTEVLPTGIPPREGGGAWVWDDVVHNQPLGADLQRDGYTSLLPLSDDTLLIAYCDMAHPDARGRKRKALKVRSVSARRA